MKKVLPVLFSLFVCQQALAQVAISNPSSNPDPSAMLDVKSNNRGFLMPRLTNRTNVAAPVAGLMVYETATNAVWVYNGTAWVQLGSGGGSSEWLVNGTHIYNGNTGNVGIGINAPTAKLHLAGLMKIDGGQIDIDDNIGKVRLLYNGSPKGYFSFTSSTGDVQIGTFITSNDDGKLQLETRGTPKLTILPDGNVGIGTINPLDKLDLEGSMRLGGESRQIKFETGQAGGMVTKYAPGVHFIRNDNTRLGVIEYVDTVGTNFFRFRTGSTITNDFVITTGHDICIGGSNPNAKFEVRGSGEVMRIHAGFDPLLQFSTGNAGGGIGLPLVRKGFLDVNGNDFRIGTNAENNSGNFIMRVNGSDVMKITPEGLVNIPTGDDASLTTHGYLMLGTVAGSSIVLDNNEIIARGANGTTGNLVLQNDGGTVRIGSVAVPAGYKFAINGKAICEELKVKLASSGWPDYVFADNYQLRSLNQLEKYIQQNKHLPNIPSAAEVEKNGLEVGDMQKRMMEKIEELTLYIIDLQKQIEELKSKNTADNK